MDDVQCFSYRHTGHFSDLICDYLDQDESLSPFYNRFPSIENFERQIAARRSFSQASRDILVKSLKAQYSCLGTLSGSGRYVQENIESLGKSNTFTVTTGHQLSLFTGPLYFIYKIVSTIKLAEELQKAYPTFHFVPVYWMASEDHDFEEINHINLKDGQLSWDNKASGPVGKMKTTSLVKVIEDLSKILGPGKHSDKLRDLLNRSYLEQENMANATRCLVHELFAEKGLVIIDGDDAALKREAISFFQADLIDHIPFQQVGKTSAKLAENYFEQVHIREVNLFYIEKGLRERIERKGDKWTVLNTDIVFNGEELKRKLEDHPEKFSPNVALRPLYQEWILPNLSYTGGGGELAYWFQLKGMFDYWKIPFPMLVLRNSVLWISAKQEEKLKKMEITLTDIFKGREVVKSEQAKNSAPVDPELKPYREKVEEIFDQLEDVAQLTDKSMLGAVNAQRQKQLNGLDNLRKKLLKAEKRRNSDLMERIDKIYDQLFPGDGLQERHDNFLFYYREYGDAFIQTLFEKLNPLEFQFCVIVKRDTH